MSKQAERRAAELFEEYLNNALGGRQQPVERFLDQCPKSQKGSLQEALDSVDFLIEHYYCPRLSRTAVDELFNEVQEIHRRQQALRQARAKAARVAPEAPIADPAEYLRDLMGFPAALVAGTAQSKTAPSGMSTQGFAVMHRGEASHAAERGGWVDKVQQRARDRGISEKAEEVLRRTMVTEAPIDVRQVADGLGLFIQEACLPEGVDGCIATDGKTGGILINKLIEDLRRRRYTTGHETGHFVLHKDVTFIREGVDEIGSAFRSQREREANVFASYLLMPSFLLPEDFGRKPPLLAHADELVERFDVSLAAALQRLVRDSHFRCALVTTQEGVVKWAVRSWEFDGYIPSGSKPHPDTIAALLLRSGGPAEDGTRLPADAWVEGALAEEGVYLHEESRRLGNGYVYTLLTVIEEEQGFRL